MNTRPPDPSPPDGLRRAWHDASAEVPPERVDQAILAAARAAVKPPRAAPRSMRWWSPGWQRGLAAAAVAGIAFVLAQVLPHGTESSRAPPERAPTPAVSGADRPRAPSMPTHERTPQAETTIEAPAPRPAGASARETEKRAAQPDVAPAPGAPQESDVAAESPEPAQGTDLRDRADVVAAGAPAELPAPGARSAAVGKLSAESAVTADAESRAIADEVARVVELHANGDLASAAEALRQLRRRTAHADGLLPDSLREWARTVR